ncbi:sn-glycerol-3-phosphate ABC transporter ATP-binding protein UgpC [bacterium]|nr:sn-glycerol-3-phosphate ABC transporter ATP-binding protein UgpC [candidate division CSSED10-310 bacterium]
MAGVLFEAVSKYFENVKVIDRLSFTIDDREFVVIVGPSGCGKSTSLRMIAGLETVSSGNVYIGDKIVNDVLPRDRDIAMVFQNYALYPHMNVYRNMAFGLQLRKYPREEIDRRVKRAADILGINQFLDRKPKQLSGGQRQRVAVGRAIVREPAVFLFDEPLSNLDAKLRVQMRSEIRKLHLQLNTTMIYVTHDQVEAMTMGDRIIILKDGILQQVGSPMQIYRNPQNLFVAGFIGSPAMNMIPGRLERFGDSLAIKTSVCEIEIKPEIRNRFKLDSTSNVILGIRPEDLVLTGNDDQNRAFGELTGHVDLVETTGAESMVHLSVHEIELVARVTSYSDIRHGQTLNLVFNLAKIHLFDRDTQESLCRDA